MKSQKSTSGRASDTIHIDGEAARYLGLDDLAEPGRRSECIYSLVVDALLMERKRTGKVSHVDSAESLAAWMGIAIEDAAILLKKSSPRERVFW